jgi:hypothetical protein
MNKKYSGHWACSQVTYGFDTEPTFIANYHCTDCKRASGERWRHSRRCLTQISPCSAETPRASPTGPNAETCAAKHRLAFASAPTNVRFASSRSPYRIVVAWQPRDVFNSITIRS